MARLVDQGRLDHEEEPIRILGQLVDGRLGHLHKAGLVRELRDAALFQELPVERGVHVAGVEEPEQLALVGTGGRSQPGFVRRQRIAGVLEQREIVLLVLALGACDRLRQEIGGTPAENHFGLHIVEHADDLGLVVAPPRMRHDRSRGRIFDFGVRDDADSLAAGASQRSAMVSTLGSSIVSGVRSA